MADKNNNGKDDSKEYAAGQKVAHPMFPWLAGNKKGPKLTRANEGKGSSVSLAEFFNSPMRQGFNFLGDLGSGFSRNKNDSIGTGVGDQIFGVAPGYYADRQKDTNPRSNESVGDYWLRSMFPTNGARITPVSGQMPQAPAGPEFLSPEWRAQHFGARGDRGPVGPQSADMSFADTLAQAIEMMRNGGGGGVNYDPQRQTARDNAATADSNLAAMYAGLVNSIAADAQGIGTAYDTTGQRQQAITDETGQAIQQGYQAGTDMLTQQAQALGIEQAVANQIQNGSAPAGDLVQRLADNAAAGQTAQTQNATNRQAAVQYNDVVKNAAQQEGAQQRAQRQADLQSILADIDIAEQDANRSAQANQYSNAVSLAQWLYGNQTDERRYQDALSKDAASLANERYIAELENQPQQAMQRVSAESEAFIQNLLGFEDPKQYQMWKQENPSGWAAFAKMIG